MYFIRLKLLTNREIVIFESPDKIKTRKALPRLCNLALKTLRYF